MVATTRFNTETYEEFSQYHISHKVKGCVYNTPKQITESIPYDSHMFIIEMNNSINKIMGIGYIRNHLKFDKRYNVYSIQNYNRYTYSGKYRFTRILLMERFKETIEKMEQMLFYGSTHLKRGHGIIRISQKKLNEDKELTKEMLIMFMMLRDKYIIPNEINSTSNRKNNESIKYIKSKESVKL